MENTNNLTNNNQWFPGFEITFVDSFFCEPHVAVYGDTASALIRDRTIQWMESVGFKGVSYRTIEVGYQWRGDLDAEHRAGRHPWRAQ